MIKNNHQQHCSIVKTTFAQAFKKINKIKKRQNSGLYILVDIHRTLQGSLKLAKHVYIHIL